MIQGISAWRVVGATIRMAALRPGQLWSGPAVACLLLAGCATSGGSPSPVASEQNAPPKTASAVARPADASPGIASGETISTNPEVVRRRRLVIAEMLEEQHYFRTIYDFKLSHAELAGPVERINRNLFTGATRGTATYYCVSAVLESPLIPTPKAAMIRVASSSGGFERFQVSDASPLVCGSANYGSFPELEELRAQRRKKAGKVD